MCPPVYVSCTPYRHSLDLSMAISEKNILDIRCHVMCILQLFPSLPSEV